MYLQAFGAVGQPLHDSRGAEDDLDEILASRPDLLILLGTPQDMLRDVQRSVEAGVAVVVEKPVGRCADELEPLAALAQQRGAFVSVAQPHLLNEFWDVCTPELGGPLSHLRFRLVNGSPERYAAWGVPWVMQTDVVGGGALRNLGVHGVSAFLKATTGEVQVHSCVLSRRLFQMETEEYAAVTLSAGGVIGQIEVGYTAALDEASDFELSGHHQNLSVRDDGQALTVLDRHSGQTRVQPVLPLARRYEQFAAATVQALEAGGLAPHSLADHLAAMRVIDACYARAVWADA
ncbi:Oxidoreductase [Deinococcus marmoris]|uniref:Oxidoreductase n=2 Tax=Deinococcus marmoris TaxID=249408 RepID=A0A1U7NWP3_9DEIO|nr:Oxidoreductase [Deinococcus marmoris]